MPILLQQPQAVAPKTLEWHKGGEIAADADLDAQHSLTLACLALGPHSKLSTVMVHGRRSRGQRRGLAAPQQRGLGVADTASALCLTAGGG